VDAEKGLRIVVVKHSCAKKVASRQGNETSRASCVSKDGIFSLFFTEYESLLDECQLGLT
jgi:hypothetical protein